MPMTKTSKQQTLKESLRLFQCARCLRQVKICTSCDRGNIYCGPACARLARKAARCAASKRYQRTSRGKENHARCQKRYREKQRVKIQDKMNKVIDHGSYSNPHGLCFSTMDEERFGLAVNYLHCDFCGRRSNAYARRDFLNHYRRTDVALPSSSMAVAQGP